MGTCTKVTRSPNSRAATYGRPPAWLTTANADKLMTRLPQAQVALISWTAGLIGLTPDSTVPPARLPHTLWTSLTFADEYHRTTVRRTNTNHTKVDRIPPTLHRVTTAATTLHNELALTGISHAIRIERGSQGTQRLHAHALITPTRRRHHIYASDLITEWNRHHGFSHQRRPITGSELTIVAYALKHESREHYLADYTTMIGSWNKQRHVIETIIR